MKLQDKLRIAYRAFRGAPFIAQTEPYGDEGRPFLVPTQEEFYSKCGIIYACIKLRSDTLSRPVLRVYDGTKPQPVTKHPLVSLLARPNPFYTRADLWRTTESDLCTWGNEFWAVERDKGKPVEIWRMRPDWVRVIPDGKNFISGYTYSIAAAGGELNWGVDEVIAFRYPNPFSEYWGVSPLTAARMSGEFNMDAMMSNRYFFKNYAMPATGLSTKEPMTEAQAKLVLKWWNEALVGAKQQHRTMVMPFGLEPKQLQISPKDAEWVQGMRFSIEEIARIFRVPSPLIGEEKAVYRNIKEAEMALWHETIIPELMWIEEILNTFLVPMFRDDLFVAFDLSGVEALQEDANAVAERHCKYVEKGIKTINEIRTKELNMPKVPWGDDYYMPLNLFPVKGKKAGDLPNKPEDATEQLQRTVIQLLQAQTDTDEAIAADWTEMQSLLANFFMSERDIIAAALSKTVRQAAYDWQRWVRRLKTPIANILVNNFKKGANEIQQTLTVAIDFDLINERAVEKADELAGKLVGVGKKYKVSITEETRRHINGLISNAVREGKSVNEVYRLIADDRIFSPARAQVIARTETQRAYNEGSLAGYHESGVVTGKEWISTTYCCDVCDVNAAQGAVPLNDTFDSGHQAPPAHPNCVCTLRPVIEE